MATLMEKLRSFFNKEEPRPVRQDVIPPGADLYGAGPNFINDSDPAIATAAGDPYAPAMGKTMPTHQQVIEEGRFGNPRQNPSHPDDYWERRDVDEKQRHSAQIRDANGWNTPVSEPVKPVPAVRPPTNRWTGSAHPELDSTAVPSATGMQPYEFNGMHFSMADHRRDFEIYGMQPQKSRRNTYRVEPTPWDLDLIDTPSEDEVPLQATYEVPSTFMSDVVGNRNYRLGG